MIDPRFYVTDGPLSLATLFSDCEIRGDGQLQVGGLAGLSEAGAGDLTFHDGSRPWVSRASAVVVRAAPADFPQGGALIVSAHPRAAFAAAARRLWRPRGYAPGIAVAPDSHIEEGVVLGANVTLGADARIGAGASIGPGAVIGPGVRIGRRACIGARAIIECALVGDDVTVLAGAAIGQAGFGVAPGAAGAVDMPHFGRVIIGDRATIGANTCIDRGLFADTIIGEDAKIDNLCHIAHNAVIGRGAVMAAFAGISGSTVIGDGVLLGGRVGVVDHAVIGAGAQIAAGSSVLTSVPERERWGGYPAKAFRRWARELAWLSRAAGRRDAGE